MSLLCSGSIWFGRGCGVSDIFFWRVGWQKWSIWELLTKSAWFLSPKKNGIELVKSDFLEEWKRWQDWACSIWFVGGKIGLSRLNLNLWEKIGNEMAQSEFCGKLAGELPQSKFAKNTRNILRPPWSSPFSFFLPCTSGGSIRNFWKRNVFSENLYWIWQIVKGARKICIDFVKNKKIIQ